VRSLHARPALPACKLLARLDGGARQRQPLLAAMAQVISTVGSRLCSAFPTEECRRRFYFAFAALSTDPTPGAFMQIVSARGVAGKADSATTLGGGVGGVGGAAGGLGGAAVGRGRGLGFWR
jgi:hypothetical protein